MDVYAFTMWWMLIVVIKHNLIGRIDTRNVILWCFNGFLCLSSRMLMPVVNNGMYVLDEVPYGSERLR